MKKAQTATEYLIILAVVIIIALIVVGVLGDIPGIGGGSSNAADNARLKSLEIGIASYSIFTTKTELVIQNNRQNRVRINNITLGGAECGISTFILQPGAKQRKTCFVGGITSGEEAQFEIVADWTDLTTNAEYTQEGRDIIIQAEVANSDCSGTEINGVCWQYNGSLADASCDTICAQSGGTCAPTNWNDLSCSAMQQITGCSGCVASGNVSPYAPAFPAISMGGCFYRNAEVAQSCGLEYGGGGDLYRLCSCSK